MKALLLLALLVNVRSDFYPVKLTIVNHPEMQRDFSVSWEKRWPVEIIDEDTRYEAHLVEELENRRLHLNKVFEIRFIKNGDISSIIHNRVSYKLPNHLFETPLSYEFLEYVESELFHELDVELWEKKKERLRYEWEAMDFLLKGEFLMDMDVDIDYEYYEYEFGYYEDDDEVYIDGEYVTYESLGYVSPPKPQMPARPKRKRNPFGFRLE